MTDEQRELHKLREEYLRNLIKEELPNRMELVHKLQDYYPKFKISYHMAKMNQFPREYIELRKGSRIWRINTDQYDDDYIKENIADCVRTKDCALLYEEEVVTK
jgi:hypothetical protein